MQNTEVQEETKQQLDEMKSNKWILSNIFGHSNSHFTPIIVMSTPNLSCYKQGNGAFGEHRMNVMMA